MKANPPYGRCCWGFERQPQGELNQARLIHLAADYAERGRAKTLARVSELDPVEDIEKLGAELEIDPTLR